MANGDRNLLFGIIAMQLDFITREQLIAATSKWIQDKSQQIDAILLADGILAGDEQSLLSSLIDKHLEKHAGDVEQSLASLSSLSGVSSELKALGDDQIEATLSHVSSLRDATVHRTLVTSSVVGLLLVLVALAAGMVLLSRTNAQIGLERNVARANAARALHNLAKVHASMNRHNQAMSTYTQAIAEWRQLVENRSIATTKTHLSGLADSLSALAVSQLKSKEAALAHQTMDEARQIREQLYKRSPDNIEDMVELARAYVQTGDLRRGDKQLLQERLKWYANAVELVDRIDAQRQMKEGVREVVIRVYERRAVAHGQLKNFVDAAKDWEKVLPMMAASPRKRSNQLEYATALIQVGRVDGGASQLDLLAKNAKLDPTDSLGIATVFALAYAKLGTSNNVQKTSADHCAKQALKYLEVAMKSGALTKGTAKDNLLLLQFIINKPPFVALKSIPGFADLIKKLNK